MNEIWEEAKAYMADKKIIQSWYAYWGWMGTDGPAIMTPTLLERYPEVERSIRFQAYKAANTDPVSALKHE